MDYLVFCDNLIISYHKEKINTENKLSVLDKRADILYNSIEIIPRIKEKTERWQRR